MVTIPLSQASKMWSAREKKLFVTSKKDALRGANRMQKLAIRLAPKKTGETKQSIKKRKIKNGWVVESFVKGRFKHNLWANRSPPFNRPLMVWNQKRPTTYGDGSHNTTGTPGFWHIASTMTRKGVRTNTLANTRRAMKTK